MVSDTVTSVTRQVKISRFMTGITATWDLAIGTVKKHLMLLNVKRGGAPSVYHSAADPASQASVRAALGSGWEGSAVLPPARATSSQPAAPPPTDHSPPASLAQEPAPALCAGAPPVGEVRAQDFVWSYEAVTLPIGGSVPRRSWSVRLSSDETIVEEGDSIGPGRTGRPLDYVLAMFPKEKLGRMVGLTCAQLSARRFNTTTAGAVLKFIGMLVMGTCHEFGSRADL